MCPQKNIFIICEIGQIGSEVRKRADQIKKHVIDPVAEILNYITIRADFFSGTSNITSQVIDQIRNSDIIIADLTDNNPNVFYELAVVHCIQKPVILIANKNTKMLFDVNAQKVILYDIEDIDNIFIAREELKKQIKLIQTNEFIVDSPIVSKNKIYVTADVVLKSKIDINNKYSSKKDNIENKFINELVTQLQSLNLKLDSEKIFINDKGVIVTPDIFLTKDNKNYLIEIKKVISDIGFEYITQIKVIIENIKSTGVSISKTYLIILGKQPSDVIRTYADNNGIEIIWLDVTEYHEPNKEKIIQFIAGDLFRRIENDI